MTLNLGFSYFNMAIVTL